MRRDLNLVRRILLRVEQVQPGEGLRISDLTEPVDRPAAVAHHVDLLIDAGYVQAKVQRNLTGDGEDCYFVQGLTWEGSEFLESVRDGGIWATLKGAIDRRGGGLALEVVMDLAKQLGKRVLQQDLGVE